jgi:hypothetical protein
MKLVFVALHILGGSVVQETALLLFVLLTLLLIRYIL